MQGGKKKRKAGCRKGRSVQMKRKERERWIDREEVCCREKTVGQRKKEC